MFSIFPVYLFSVFRFEALIQLTEVLKKSYRVLEANGEK